MTNGLQLSDHYQDRSPLPYSRFVRAAIFTLSLSFAALCLTNNLTQFPLYFFCDEAINGIEALSLLTTGRDRSRMAWPIFIRGYGTYHISLSVYIHLIFQLFLPLTEFTIRLVGVVSGLAFCAGLTLLMQRVLSQEEKPERQYLIETISASATPLVVVSSSFFFLHFRTGFEFVISLALWVWGIVFFDFAFSLHRAAEKRWFRYVNAILSAVTFGACAYTYTPARGWVPLTLFVLSSTYFFRLLRFKWVALTGLFSMILIVTPYFWVMKHRPEVALGRLRGMGLRSWNDFQSIPLLDVWKRTLEVLNPWYWLSWSGPPSFESWERHIIPDLPLLPRYLLPFVVVGVVVLVCNFRRNPLARSLLVLFPIGIFPAVLVAVNPLRCSTIGTLLLSYGLVGAFWSFILIARGPVLQRTVLCGSLAALVTYIVYLQQYIFNGAMTKYENYGFYGLQMGQSQVFAAAKEFIAQGKTIYMTNAAFNGNEELTQFYLSPEERSHFAIREIGVPCILPASEDTGFWFIRREHLEDLEKNRTSCSDVSFTTLRTIDDPNGNVIFSLVEGRRQITQQ